MLMHGTGTVSFFQAMAPCPGDSAQGRHQLQRDLSGLCLCVAGRGTDRSQAKAQGHSREQHRRGASRPLAEQALRHRMSSAELPCFSHRTRQARCRHGDRRRRRQAQRSGPVRKKKQSGGTAMLTTQLTARLCANANAGQR